jgi:predicted PurR-regulated permease PerM
MIGAFVVAILYFAREILVPIALAALLSFVLAPLVRLLQRLRIPRAMAVLSAVSTALLIAFCLATMVMVEVSQLANHLPRYEMTLSGKVRNFRDVIERAGIFRNSSNLLKDLDRQLNAKDQNDAPPTKSTLQEDAGSRLPIPVEVHQPDPAASETLVAILRPLLAPFTTANIVFIFLMFFLFQREDLRNRFIRLVGSEDLERTTAALDDAAGRLSKLFLTQLIINAIFGTVIGLGLAVIGVPSAPLWGLFAMILRFIPYIGAILAAALPVVLAAAVGSDWSMTLWTIALFAVVEPFAGQVVESLVCGRSAGLSPVAVVVAASFWTWLWGPLGLLLSTPLTLCLVVLARHVDRLQFIDVMLGDHPALNPQQAAYQRMLTGDPIEAIEQARSFLKEQSVEAYYEEILLGALRLAVADAALGRLDDKRLENISQTVSEILEDLGSHKFPSEERSSWDKPAKRNVVDLITRKPGLAVFCTPGLGRLDICAAMVLTDFLKRGGANAKMAAATPAIGAEIVCVCFLESITEARRDYTIRKLSRQAPAAKVLVCLLGEQGAGGVEGRSNGAACSLSAAVTAIEKSVALSLDRREQ